MIRPQQQNRLHVLVESCFNIMRTKNTDSCELTMIFFGEAMCYFIAGGDETCMMLRDGNTHAIGASDRKKHEKKLLD